MERISSSSRVMALAHPVENVDECPQPVDGVSAFAESSELRAVVAEVNRLQRLGNLRTARAIGDYLIRVFFENDASRIHDRRRHPLSFRALAKHPELEVSASYLFIAVAVSEQAGLLPKDVVEVLPFRSQRHLLAVKDPVAKAELAREAVMAGWSSRAMQDRVEERLRKVPAHRRSGRPRIPDFVRALRLMKEAAETAASVDTLFDDVKRFGWCASQMEADGFEAAMATLAKFAENLKETIEGQNAVDIPGDGC